MGKSILDKIKSILVIIISCGIGLGLAWLIYQIITFALFSLLVIFASFIVYANIMFRKKITLNDYIIITNKKLVSKMKYHYKYEGLVVEIGIILFSISDTNGRIVRLPIHYVITRNITMR